MEIKRENPASRQTRIAAFVRKNTVLLIALALAVLSIALVPPDEAYAGYYDLKTLCCLFGTLAVVCALAGPLALYGLATVRLDFSLVNDVDY